MTFGLFDEDDAKRVGRATHIVEQGEQRQWGRLPGPPVPSREDVIVVKSTAAVSAPSSNTIYGGTFKVQEFVSSSTGGLIAATTRAETVYNLGSAATSASVPYVAKRHYKSGAWVVDPSGGTRWAFLDSPKFLRTDGSTNVQVFANSHASGPGFAQPVFRQMRNDIRTVGFNVHTLTHYKDPQFTCTETADYLIEASWRMHIYYTGSWSSNWDTGSTTITSGTNSTGDIHSHTVTAIARAPSKAWAALRIYKKTSSTATSSEWTFVDMPLQTKLLGWDGGSDQATISAGNFVARLEAGNQLRLEAALFVNTGGSSPREAQCDRLSFYIENLGQGSTTIDPATIAVSPT